MMNCLHEVRSAYGPVTEPRGCCVLLVALLLVWVAGPAHGQLLPEAERVKPFVSMDAAAATDDMAPFWLVSNRYGTFDRAASNVVTRVGAVLEPREDRWFDVAAGVDLVARGSENAALYAHELYGRVVAGPFRVTGGRAERVQGIIDTTLSIGSTTMSRNATPIPSIRVDAPNYIDVPFTQGFVAVKGSFGHGWLEKNRWVESPYLHTKQLYGRLFPERWPVQLHGGILHNVVWAGTHPAIGDLADGFSNFLKVVFVQELEGTEDLPGEAEDSGVGNTVAAYDFAVTAQAKDWRGGVYREFFIDTAAGKGFRNVWDGLWGVNLVRRDAGGLVDRVLYEHLRFVRHNAIWGAEGRIGARGRENYYNNYIYESGWTYAGRVLGTPLALTDAGAPRMASDADDDPITNNIIVANHLGVAGHLTGTWRYRTVLTYSRNHGTYFNQQPRRDQLAGLVEVTGPVLPDRGLTGTVGLAADFGEVFADRVGLHVGLSWCPDRWNR